MFGLQKVWGANCQVTLGIGDNLAPLRAGAVLSGDPSQCRQHQCGCMVRSENLDKQQCLLASVPKGCGGYLSRDTGDVAQICSL